MIHTPKTTKVAITTELEKRKLLGTHLSTVIGMETLAHLREYDALRALVKNSLVTLTNLFFEWNKAKFSLRAEFLSEFDKTSIFFQKLLYASPLCTGLFPISLVEEVRAKGEALALGVDQLLNIHKPRKYVKREKKSYGEQFGKQAYRPSQTQQKNSSPKQSFHKGPRKPRPFIKKTSKNNKGNKSSKSSSNNEF